MDVDKKILDRLNDMVDLGKQVLATRREPRPGHVTSDFVDTQRANQWFTSCLNLFSRVFGKDSEYYKNMNRNFVGNVKYPEANQAFGVLLSAKDDYEKESIFELRALIEAELFEDFLEQAEHLLSTGYFAPAAVIAGSVLEDGLRKLCGRERITLSSQPKLDFMNAELAKAGTYSKLTQKRITALADIRNNAAHGKWSEFDTSDVENMIRDVRNFMEKYYV